LPRRSPACAGGALLITSLTGCSTTRITFSAAGAAEGAAAAIEDARGIGTGLRCEPLLTRADAVRLEAGHAR
jgi:hypothetical protein